MTPPSGRIAVLAVGMQAGLAALAVVLAQALGLRFAWGTPWRDAAIGLAAAIPAYIAYNKFSIDAGKFTGRLESFADDLQAAVARRLGAPSAPPPPPVPSSGLNLNRSI